MALTTYNFTRLVSNIATAMQASASASLDFTPGSVLRALCEAISGTVLWLQAIILQLLTLTRAATSKNADLDSWMADYDFTRLPASYATGQVTFSRFTPTQQAVVPINASVQTADGSRRFFVTLDAGNPAYNPSLGGYVLGAGIASVSVPVQAVDAGIGGNVLAGSIAVLSTPIPGVDTVANGVAFANGIDAESDPAYRARFVLYLASLSKATKTAIRYAVTSLRQGLALTITENYDYAGNYRPASFYVVVDDGTGYPSSDLLTNAGNAIEAVRADGITFAVFAPAVATANVGVTVATAPGYDHNDVVGAVGTALTRFINALPLATGLPYTRLASVIYGVPGVVNASSILLNGGTADLAADQKTKVRAGTITVA
ncbi:baseplate J/gp47 family protein [Tundrisphaera sp. TA3]|uniref:baseplate J/gp47 family protein n=1 Tax=Tundrisphaera sp. TA3 TaxID=3435775 RepID=UPI003EBAFBE5